MVSNLEMNHIGLLGEPLGSCVTTGPFAEFNITLDPGPPPANMSLTAGPGRCLKRNFQIALTDVSFQWKINVAAQLQQTPYSSFTAAIDMDVAKTGATFGLHGGGHSGVGGEVRAIFARFLGFRLTLKMLNVWSSINDPLFFMHHANLDRIWSIWQRQAPQNLYDIGGPVWPFGAGPGTVTLNSTLDFGLFMAPSQPASAVMDTLNANGQGILCYQYETYVQP
jgi:tyrosinase